MWADVERNKIMAFAATRMDLEIIILSEISQVGDITYTWNLKKRYKWTYLQNRHTLIDLETKPKGLPKGKRRWRRDNLGVWD